MKRTNNFFKFALFIAMTILFGSFTQENRAATFTVNSNVDVQDANPGNGVCQTATAGQCTLRAAITEANALAGDDVITLPAGFYTASLPSTFENANAGGDFDIASSITINGAGAGSTFIQTALSDDYVLHFVEREFFPETRISTVNGVTIRNGGNVGAYIDSRTNVTLNSVILGNNAGGGVYLNGGTLAVNNSSITNNFSTGIVMIGGTAAVNNSIISFNTYQSVAATNLSGGGVRINNGTLNLNNCSIRNNSVTVTNSGGSANGGGIAVLAGAVTLTDSSVTNNAVAATAGGASNGGGIDITNSALVFTSLILNKTFVGGNSANSGGGIRRAGLARLEVNQSAIINNTAATNAGGILNTAVSVDANFISINNSTIAENKTNGFGGGIMNSPFSSPFAARIDVNFSTVARNVANQDNTGTESGGGIFNSSQSNSLINLKNSIVADNTVGTGGVNPDVSGVITSQGYNHVENVGSAAFAPTTGDATGTDPLLGALILNGSNSVFIPAANSPITDAIPNSTSECGVAPFAVDQRGVARPKDSNGDTTAACEKGAVETLSSTSASVSISGRIMAGKNRGVGNAVVYLTDMRGDIRAARTNALGFYRFNDVAAGETYLFNVFSKRHVFQPQVLTVMEEVQNLDFEAEP